MPTGTELHNQICRKFKNNEYSHEFLSAFSETGCSRIQKVILEDIVSQKDFIHGFCDVVIDYEDDDGKKQKALIEVKSSADVINKDTNDVLRKIKKYRFHKKSITRTFLVYPRDASTQPIVDTSIFTDENIKVLDINKFIEPDEKKRLAQEEKERKERIEKEIIRQKNTEILNENMAQQKRLHENMPQNKRKNAIVLEHIIECPECPNNRMVKDASNSYWVCTRCGRKIMDGALIGRKKDAVQNERKNVIVSEHDIQCPGCQNHRMVKDASNPYWVCTRCGRKIEIENKQSTCENETIHLVQKENEKIEKDNKEIEWNKIQKAKKEEEQKANTREIRKMQSKKEQKAKKKQIQDRKDLVQSILGLICLIVIIYYVGLPILQIIVTIFFGGDYLSLIVFSLIMVGCLAFVLISMSLMQKLFK